MPQPYQKYRIVRELGNDEFQDTMNRLSADGWVPAGPLNTAVSNDRIQLIQLMTKQAIN